MDNKNVKQTLTHKEFVRLKTLGILGLVSSDINPDLLAERYTFVNDINEIKRQRLEEYNIWYVGDSDRLKNYFTRDNAIQYNYDPLYNENKKSYFWAVASTEKDIKRTHSGHPRNIVDTLVYIMTVPDITNPVEEVNTVLQKILKENKFKQKITQKSRPLTLVEGWGAWKINWDKDLSEYPILLYYRADRVDFIFQSEILRAIIYQDYFQDDKGQNYILYETRRLGPYKDPKNPEGPETTSLFIEKELYRLNQTDAMTPCKLSELPQLKDVKARVVISNFRSFLGYPNIFYHDSSEEFPGRSIFTGKTDIFDDLDQCFSQSANTVRRSTVHEYFNNLYLETDQEGFPIQPTAFDRKYVFYAGTPGADGATAGSTPVQVVQPNVNFAVYSQEEQNLLLNAISGIMSPATMGIDIARKDNAAAQREKEKVTIFTRNNLLDEEQDIWEHVCSDLLVANELMNLGENEQLTCKKYDISVKYGEFANDSFEGRAETITTMWQAGIMSDGMAVNLLYGDNISESERKKELDFIAEQRKKAEQGPMMPEDQGPMGILGADNEYNDAHEKVSIEDLKGDMGVPELTQP